MEQHPLPATVAGFFRSYATDVHLINRDLSFRRHLRVTVV